MFKWARGGGGGRVRRGESEAVRLARQELRRVTSAKGRSTEQVRAHRRAEDLQERERVMINIIAVMVLLHQPYGSDDSDD